MRLEFKFFFLSVLVLAGCARAPVLDSPASPIAQDAATIAEGMLGKPYRYGGNNPQGFDCSGLVYFSFRRAGLKVPRSTASQRTQSHLIQRSRPARGDLVFFDQEGRRSSHVGIYLGNNRFVHAPSSGKHVRIDSLGDPFWKKHLVDIRRF